MSQITTVILVASIGVGVVCILLYLIFERRITSWLEFRKQNRDFKRNRKILDMLYNDIMFKKSVLDEDVELNQIVEHYPCLAEDVERYRQFRNSCFTGDIIEMKNNYNDTEEE